MHPWITGRISETVQHDARIRSEQERLRRHAVERRATEPVPRREPRRARLGLALARAGFRLAGRDATPPAVWGPAAATRTTDPSRWSNPWTTCGAGSPSPR